MTWIKIALEYCNLALISSLEQKKAIFNIKYQIVLRTPYSKAQWRGGGAPTKIDSKKTFFNNCERTHIIDWVKALAVSFVLPVLLDGRVEHQGDNRKDGKHPTEDNHS